MSIEDKSINSNTTEVFNALAFRTKFCSNTLPLLTEALKVGVVLTVNQDKGDFCWNFSSITPSMVGSSLDQDIPSF